MESANLYSRSHRSDYPGNYRARSDDRRNFTDGNCYCRTDRNTARYYRIIAGGERDILKRITTMQIIPEQLVCMIE